VNCLGCGQPLDPALAPAVTHPNCLVFDEPHGGDPFSVLLKDQLIEIILAQEKRHPRGHQVAIGPSEIGDLCDRRIGYRIAGIEACNTDFDPWAAIVGTAVHTWLEAAVTTWCAETATQDWSTETALHLNEFIEGHADLYWHPHQTVVDWKTAGPDIFKKVVKTGPSVGYMIQTHIYGYLFERAGIPVKKVALAFLPRAGWLKDMFVWSADYDRGVATQALNRVYEIAHQLVSKDILNQSHRWEQIDAVPSNSCGFCPFYDPGRDPERGADATGCPGR
jgi:hypothetical protein